MDGKKSEVAYHPFGAEVPKQDAKASDAVASGTRLVPLTPKEAPTGAAPLKSTGRDDAHKFELLTAASKNDCERIKLLVLTFGVDASAVDYDNRSALHITACQGHLEATEFLVKQGAAINARDNFSFSPLDEAVRNGHRQVASLLREHGGEFKSKQLETDLINYCAGLGDKGADESVAEVKKLLEAGIDPNCKDYDGRTPLHLAVAENNVPMTRLLIAHQADRDASDRWQGTPAMEAKRHANRTGVNEMAALFDLACAEREDTVALSAFSIFFGMVQVALVALFFTCTKYSGGTGGGDEAVIEAAGKMDMYAAYQDVNVMIFIGFGYLMTFLRKNAYNSLGLTFLVSALVIQWHLLMGDFIHQVFAGHPLQAIELSLEKLVHADFACAAVLITYGALLGKVSPLQLGFIGICEVVFYAINSEIGIMLGITDVGGSMVVHMFGAYFGLAASRVLASPKHSSHDKNSAVYHSDMLAMIGTVFLFMFWPSFNGALRDGVLQQRVVVNTMLALVGSCVSAFVASHILRRIQKFDMVDIQNATLAGGVAMGTSADLLIGPGGAACTGMVAGAVSVLGYVHLQPLLEGKLHVHDTCGVHNLHGMPSIIGALAGVLTTALVTPAAYGDVQLGIIFGSVATGDRTASHQAVLQLAYVGITLVISVGTGALTGCLVKGLATCMPPPQDEGDGGDAAGSAKDHQAELFSDERYWRLPQRENPYYFDERGEVVHQGGEAAAKTAQLNSTRLEAMEKQIKILAGRASSADAKANHAGLETVFGKILAKLQ